jgi:CRP/FNR family cyclic AMP-dependent transcriptional regulator
MEIAPADLPVLALGSSIWVDSRHPQPAANPSHSCKSAGKAKKRNRSSVRSSVGFDLEDTKSMVNSGKSEFDTEDFLATAGIGRRIVTVLDKEAFFSQGDAADSVFYLQSGSAKLTVVAENGKVATITHLASGDFVGEESLASVGAMHMATATATADCTALKIERGEMLRAMHEERPLVSVFIQFLLDRGMSIQSDLVDQLFNSSEKRLARLLLLMAEFGASGGKEVLIPEVSEETLAETIGTTPSKVAFFMNRFRELGLIEYDGRIRVRKALLNVIMHDRFPDDNATKPPIGEVRQRPSKSVD